MSEVKYCVDCKYCWNGPDYSCCRPELLRKSKSLVTGMVEPLHTPEQLRSDAELCGRAAKWFE